MRKSDAPPEDAGRPAVTNRVLDNIADRRSVRRYLKTPVPENLLRLILEAANCAPSAHNKQSWKFVVLREEAKDRLAGLVNDESGHLPRKMRVLMRLASQIVKAAPVVVAIFSTGELMPEMGGEGSAEVEEFFRLMEIQSASAAVENLMLAANSLGLGTVWLGTVCLIKEKMAAAVGESGELMAVVPVGYPATPPSAPPRKKPLSEVTVY